jgi:hypothetical protein
VRKTIFILFAALLLAALLPRLAFAWRGDHLSDEYAIAALRAVVHAQTFGAGSDAESAKELELVNEADVQATSEMEQQSFETIKNVVLGGWRSAHSEAQVQACYAALKAALKKRDGVTPAKCK